MLGLYAVLYAKLWFTTRYRWAGLRPERRKKSTNSVAKRETKFLVQVGALASRVLAYTF